MQVHSGSIDPQFAALRDAFAANFTDGLEQGAAVAVTLDGQVVVDLWDGHTDAEGHRPWARDTLVNVWSTTKGPVSLAIAMLVDRGLLDYEAPVARYWPEFAAAGKDEITLGCMMAHQAGLPGCDTPIGYEEIYAWDPMVERLAAMNPMWTPGEHCGYHALTFGHLAGEVVRRVDGRSIGTFIAEEISQPLNAAFFVGLPCSEDDRVAEIIAGPGTNHSTELAVGKPYAAPAYLNPKLDAEIANQRSWRAAEVPGGNGHGDALGLARIYGALSQGGMIDDHRLIGPQALAAACAERFRGLEIGFDNPMAFGAGFMLNVDGLFGPSPRALGHSGWGGSFAFADPDTGLGVAYVMNRMQGFGDDPDPRRVRLLETLYACM
jgi:CubicO group peptidase (beta-lactamase class C family)